MAKDPAFLFYPGDFQGGTMTMSRHLKGCYIDLLIAQFNSGPLSLEEIRTVLGNDFAAWGSLSKKFEEQSGKFCNKRLEAEILKRRAYIEKQTANGKKGGRPNGNNPRVNPNKTQPQSNKESEDRIENLNGFENYNQGGAGGNEPSMAQVEEIFTQAGLTADEGSEFFTWVNGKHGWNKINNWLDYTVAVIKRKLNEKKNDKNGRKQFGTKTDLIERNRSADDFLRKSGYGGTGV